MSRDKKKLPAVNQDRGSSRSLGLQVILNATPHGDQEDRTFKTLAEELNRR